MENENMFLTSINPELNCSNFFNPIWENNTVDQSGGGVDFFGSALSSKVSSPTASNNNNNGNNGENGVLRELIGKLGSICNNNSISGGEISPQPYNNSNIHYNNNNNNNNNNTSAHTSCYSTPLSSPPKPNLSNHQMRGNVNLQNNQKYSNSLLSLPQFSTDPGFVERAAMFSRFADNHNLGGGFVPQLDSSSASSMVVSSSHHQIREQISAYDKKSNNSELNDSRENSTVSEQITPGGEIGNDSKKRKSSARGKGKENPQLSSNPRKDVPSENSETSGAKRIKSEDDQNEKDSAKNTNKSDANQKQQSKDNSKNTEPPKDYIHVRARRGQATDAHSLAERVRREKISERMKVLQDLVPGCNKVTGKAVMLDEIINYVQSLQRQVEFLSMKLATVNPRMDFNMEALASKDMFQSLGVSFPHDTYASDCYPLQAQENVHSSVLNGMEPFIHASHFNETMSQASTFLEDDLHSVVQMGILKNQAQCFNGMLATAQMKAEQ